MFVRIARGHCSNRQKGQREQRSQGQGGSSSIGFSWEDTEAEKVATRLEWKGQMEMKDGRKGSSLGRKLGSLER